MLEQGLVIETRERPAPELDDERRRYYRITPLGGRGGQGGGDADVQTGEMGARLGFAPGRA